MKLKLHHVNFATTDVPAMDAFYRDVLDMQTIPNMGANRKRNEGYPGDVAFVTDGAMQMHIAEKDMEIGFGHCALPAWASLGARSMASAV